MRTNLEELFNALKLLKATDLSASPVRENVKFLFLVKNFPSSTMGRMSEVVGIERLKVSRSKLLHVS